MKLRKTDVSSDRSPAGSRNTPSASTNADSQQAARRQLNPFAPATPAPMSNGDLFGTADPNQLTHTGYGNVSTAGQVAPNPYGNVPSSNLSPFDQLDNGSSTGMVATEKPPPLPVDKPADMLTHTGYANVNRDHSSMATPFDDAPPPPMPKPSNLAPLRAGGGGGGGGSSSTNRAYPELFDPFSGIPDSSAYKNVNRQRPATGSEILETYEQVERDDEIPDSGSDTEDPFR